MRRCQRHGTVVTTEIARMAHFLVRKNGHPGAGCFASPIIFISQWRHPCLELIWRHSTIPGIGKRQDMLAAGGLQGLPSVPSIRYTMRIFWLDYGSRRTRERCIAPRNCLDLGCLPGELVFAQ